MFRQNLTKEAIKQLKKEKGLEAKSSLPVEEPKVVEKKHHIPLLHHKHTHEDAEGEKKEAGDEVKVADDDRKAASVSSYEPGRT